MLGEAQLDPGRETAGSVQAVCSWRGVTDTCGLSGAPPPHQRGVRAVESGLPDCSCAGRKTSDVLEVKGSR